jgi:hypothetical protein
MFGVYVGSCVPVVASLSTDHSSVRICGEVPSPYRSVPRSRPGASQIINAVRWQNWRKWSKGIRVREIALELLNVGSSDGPRITKRRIKWRFLRQGSEVIKFHLRVMPLSCSGCVNAPYLQYSNAVSSLLANSKNQAVLHWNCSECIMYQGLIHYMEVANLFCLW